jgi:dolichol-phosphate mannosyltransferase
MESKYDVSIVVPLYNEEDVFSLLIKRLNNLISSVDYPLEIVLVDDGSVDNTRNLMQEVAMANSSYQCIYLSRNHGHQLALSAGLKLARGTKAIMVIDGDLQDPPELLHELYSKFKEGFDVVYAIRKKRKESWLKRSAYFLYYRLVVRMSSIKLPLDSGDFALLSRRVVDLISSMPEESRYLRGMRSWIGFKQTGVEYERLERQAGEPKYNFKMLMNLAYNGIFNFSGVPIKFITNIGLFAVGLGLVYFVYVLYLRIFTDMVPTGFTALTFLIILFGGVQLISIGVLGEYLMRVFFQVKNRPLFVIDKIVKGKKEIIYNNIPTESPNA